MNPIIRWTIPDMKFNGFLCLKKSIFSFVSLYGHSFQFFVCYNGGSLNKLENLLSSLDVSLNYIKQKKEDIPVQGQDSFWKYSPPRVNINVPELFLDNDIIFVRRSEEIVSFFEGNKFLMCEDQISFFGKYTSYFDVGEKYNAGLFGIPAGFNFEQCIYDTWKELGEFSDLKFEDEQGLTSYILKNKSPIILSKDKYITIHHRGIPSGDRDNLTWSDFNWSGEIFHFSGLNRLDFHKYWHMYSMKLL